MATDGCQKTKQRVNLIVDKQTKSLQTLQNVDTAKYYEFVY